MHSIPPQDSVLPLRFLLRDRFWRWIISSNHPPPPAPGVENFVYPSLGARIISSTPPRGPENFVNPPNNDPLHLFTERSLSFQVNHQQNCLQHSLSPFKGGVPKSVMNIKKAPNYVINVKNYPQYVIRYWKMLSKSVMNVKRAPNYVISVKNDPQYVMNVELGSKYVMHVTPPNPPPSFKYIIAHTFSDKFTCKSSKFSPQI